MVPESLGPPTEMIAVDTIFVLHDVRVMPRNLKNVTVTLDSETARWARLEAARQETSVSRLLGDILHERMEAEEGYEAARRRYLAQEPGVHRRPGQRYPPRDTLHEREGSG